MHSQYLIKKIVKSGDVKLIIIPKKSDFEVGEYVILKKFSEVLKENSN